MEKSRAEIEKLGQKWAAWGGSPGSGGTGLCTLKMQGQDFVYPKYLVEVCAMFGYCVVGVTRAAISVTVGRL